MKLATTWAVTTWALLTLIIGAPITASAESENTPPSVTEAQPPSDRVEVENTRSELSASFTFQPSMSASGADVVVPLAPQVANTAVGPPVDNAASK
jgi:hypothetical protein